MKRIVSIGGYTLQEVESVIRDDDVLICYEPRDVYPNFYDGKFIHYRMLVDARSKSDDILYIPKNHATASSMLKMKGVVDSFIYPVISFESVLRAHAPIDLLHMNCEGMETILLESVSDILCLASTMIIEFHGQKIDSTLEHVSKFFHCSKIGHQPKYRFVRK